mmetsp:Transcript_12981/g.19561  ORF Transcript_12981/g.19561 Transcript_12981/m.19561 type:complete len:657 (-) Transcript_12981:70-2040(-)
MEDALYRQSMELQRYRNDYAELSEKLARITQQLREREILYSEKLDAASSQIRAYKDENSSLRSDLQKQKDKYKHQNEKHAKARLELESVACMLEEREKVVENQLVESDLRCRRLDSRIQDLEEEVIQYMEKIGQMATTNENLNKVIENEMVPVGDYKAALTKLERYQQSVASDTVPVEKYDQMKQKYQALKDVISADMISREEYDALSDKYIRLQRRVEGMVTVEQLEESEGKCRHLSQCMQEMIPQEKYNQVQQQLKDLCEDKQLLEEAMGVHRDARERAEGELGESRARCASLQERVESSEQEIRELDGRLRDREGDVDRLTVELEECQHLLAEREEDLRRLETEKASLLVQIGNCKSLLHREMGGKGELQEKLQEAVKKADRLTEERKAMINRHARELTAIREQNSRQCEILETRCAEWQEVVDKLHEEIVLGSGTEKRLADIPSPPAPVPPGSTSDPSARLWKSTSQLRLDCDPPSPHSVASAPLPASVMAPITRRLENQEKELAEFRRQMVAIGQHYSNSPLRTGTSQGLGATPPYSPSSRVTAGSRSFLTMSDPSVDIKQKSARNSAATSEEIIKQYKLDIENRAANRAQMQSPAGRGSPMSPSVLVQCPSPHSPEPGSKILRDLQTKFDSHLQSSSTFLNGKVPHSSRY